MQWKEIASRTGITIDALKCKASRQSWNKAAKATDTVTRSAAWEVVDAAKLEVAKAAAAVQSELLGEVDRYKQSIIKLLQRGIEHLSKLSDDDLDLGAVEQLARALKMLDDVGRRTHNLDQESGKVVIGLHKTIIIQQPGEQIIEA